MKKINNNGRRDFLKTAAIGAAALALNPALKKAVAAAAAPTSPGPGNKWPGRVVINFNKEAVSGSGASAAAVPDVIKAMVSDAVLKLTGETSLGDAWKAVFPASLTASSKIGIKVNTLNATNTTNATTSPHWSSVRGIIDGLLLMNFGGSAFQAANITIYDMNNGKPEDNRLSNGGYISDNFPKGINIVTDTAVDGGDGALNNRTYAKTLKDAAFIINVFSPRGHIAITSAGSKFTLGFKSHYGDYSDAKGLHSNWDSNFREITCKGPVYNKVALSVCCGIFGMNEGNGPTGPADNFSTYAQTIDNTATSGCPTTIMMSTDPVSIEMQSIKMMRINKGGKYGTADLPPYLQASGGIAVSSLSPTYNIGTIDESKMDIRRIINAKTLAFNPALSSRVGPGIGISAHQTPGKGNVFIEFWLPHDYIDKEAIIEIADVRGSVVKKIAKKVMGAVTQLSWDQRDNRSSPVAKGVYFVRLSCGSARHASRFSIVQ